MLNNIAFTDRHGISHAAAVIEITQLDIHSYTNTSLVDDVAQEPNEGGGYSFNAKYWTNQKAKDDGLLAMPLMKADGSEQFYIDTPAPGDLAATLAAAYSYIENDVLPAMQTPE